MRFTLRDLLWLILVCAVALAWRVSDQRRAAELDATISRFNKWQDQWRAESAETIRQYRQAAFDNPGYREYVNERDRSIAAYRDYMKERERVLSAKQGSPERVTSGDSPR